MPVSLVIAFLSFCNMLIILTKSAAPINRRIVYHLREESMINAYWIPRQAAGNDKITTQYLHESNKENNVAHIDDDKHDRQVPALLFF